MAEKKKKALKKKATGAKKKKKKKAAPAPKKKATPKKRGKPKATSASKRVKAKNAGKGTVKASAAIGVEAYVGSEDTAPVTPDAIEGASIIDDILLDDMAREDDLEQDETEFLFFRTGGEGYSLRVSDVREILRHQRITYVPRCDSHVIGATSLRGAILPIIDLNLLISGSDRAEIKSGRIMVLQDSHVSVGVLVEKQIGMKGLRESRVLPPPVHASGVGGDYIKGALDIGGEFYSLLDPDAICRTRATGRTDEKQA